MVPTNKFQLYKHLSLTIFNVQLQCRQNKQKINTTLTVNYVMHLTDNKNVKIEKEANK